MSKLQELIKELCPDGVEFRKLGEVCKILRGRRLTTRDLHPNGEYPVFHGGIEPIGFYETNNREANSVMVINVGASAGTVGFCNKRFWSSDGCFCFTHNSIINQRYLFFVLQSIEPSIKSKVRKAGIPTLDNKEVERLIIPLPPLEVQNEIVRILDTFTSQIEELQAELEARKEQYEYYRNELLTFAKIGGGKQEVTWMKLGEICDMKAGKSIPASEILFVKTEEFQYPCYGGNGLRGYVSIFNQKGEKVLIGRQGALCGNVCFAENLFYATEHAVVVSDKGYCLPRYSFYLLTKMDLNQYKTSGAQPGLSVSRLEKISIPVPPLSEQQRIVSILDKFESLVNDLTTGLPAEIAAVQEQYEYYRNKLLSFKRI